MMLTEWVGSEEGGGQRGVIYSVKTGQPVRSGARGACARPGWGIYPCCVCSLHPFPVMGMGGVWVWNWPW